MTPDAADQRINALHERLRALQQLTSATPASQTMLSAEALAELAVAVEELSVAQEELDRQNEKLSRAQQALETERQRYQELFEFAPDGYVVTDAEGNIREANQAALALLQIPRNSLLGKPLVVFVVEEDRRILRTLLFQLQTGIQKKQEWEVRLRPRKGKPFPAALTVAAMRNRQGNVIALRWLLRDITQRKQLEHQLQTLNVDLERRVRERTAELDDANHALQWEIAKHTQTIEALHKSETMLNAILRTTQAVIYLLDTDNRYVYVNRQFEELVQLSGDTVRGKSVYDLFPSDIAARFEANNRTVLTSRTQLEVEETVLHPDGQPRVYHSLKAPLLDATGALRGIVGVATDITARKRLENTLRRREQEFATLVENLPDIIFRLNRELRHLFISSAVEQVIGLPPKQFLGKTGRELGIAVEACDAFESASRRVFNTGQSETVEFKDRGRLFRSRLLPEYGPDGVVESLLGITEDITEQKTIEDALRQSEARARQLAHERAQQLIQSDRRISFGELAASLAHEFNNPLGIILGFTQDLLKDVSPEHPLYHRLHIIETETQRCKRLMERLRDFARPAPMHLGRVDPAMVIHASLELVAAQCRRLWVDTTLDLPPNLPALYADHQQLQQVLLNLFFNALEVMPQGGRLTVSAFIAPSRDGTNGTSGGDEVAIAVTDTGPGIPADALAQIFRPFFTTKTKEGMGLGLSICESIMMAHGGRITVRSRVGQGTTFSLFFPVTP